MAHSCHRVCEYTRNQFRDVDRFIALMKAVFLKCNSRVQLFRNKAPNIPLPPAPVITRWGTWLKAVVYYALHWNVILEVQNGLEFLFLETINRKKNFVKLQVISAIDGEDSQAVQDLKALISENRYIYQDIKYIEQNYSFLIETINKLESGSIQMSDSLTLFYDVIQRVKSVDCNYGKKINSAFEENVRKNHDLRELMNIHKNIIENNLTDLPEYIRSSPEVINAYKRCLLTSVDCERSFSRYKGILRDDRHSFKFENLSKYIFIHCNQNFEE